MAVTLNELAKLSQTPLGKAVYLDLLRQDKLWGIVPIETVKSLAVKSIRWQTLSTVATRKIGGVYTENTGVVENIAETLFVYGGELKVDRILTLDQTAVENPLETQIKMKVAALDAKFRDDIINGDHAVDPDGFEGMKKRISNLAARYTLNVAAGGTDALKVFASEANEHLLVDALIKALHITKGNAILMNEDSYLGIGQTLRRLKLLDTTKDQYDRTWEEFKGAKLIDIGLKGDQSTEIITSTEDPGDGGNDASSMYVARWNSEDGLRALQLAGTSPEPYDPNNGGELETAPAKIRRIDWAIGLQIISKHAVCRVKGYKMAAA